MSKRDNRSGLRFARRDFLKSSALGGAAALLPWGLYSRGVSAKESPALDKFKDALPIPNVIRPANGDTIAVSMRQIRQSVHRDIGPVTTLWCYGAQATGFSSPGPTFDVRKGTYFNILWRNHLAKDPNARHFLDIDPSALDANGGVPHCTDNRKVVVHLHGGKITAAVDGFPTDFLLPGQNALYNYGIVQDAATLWYHDHAIGNTRLNVMMGLAGYFYVRDAFEVDLIEHSAGLPAYEHEIPIVLQDRRLKSNGQLAYDKRFDDSFFGDVMVVNGKAWPYLDVERRHYRLRLLNGSNSRSYTLHFGDRSTRLDFYVIGTDLGFLDAPVRTDRVTLTPGERLDIVIDFAQAAGGDDILLVNTDTSQGEHTDVPEIEEVMKLRIGYGNANDPVTLPAALREVPLPVFDPAAAAAERYFEFEDHYVAAVDDSEWLINDKHFFDVEEEVANRSYEIWSWVNKSEMMHPMHIHLAQSQILGRYTMKEDSKGNLVPDKALPVADYEMGMKDTVRVGPKELVRVISFFDGQASGIAEEYFPYHCHILEHEDFEMMRQFRLKY